MLQKFKCRNTSLSIALEIICLCPFTFLLHSDFHFSLSICTQLIMADVMGKHCGFEDSVIHVLAVSSRT